MFRNLNKVIEDYGNETLRLARRNLNLKGFAGKRNRKTNTTGKLSKGSGFRIKDTKTGIVIEFTSKEDYGKFVEEGRKKGKMPPSRELKRWVKQKKIRLRKTKINAYGQKVSEFASSTEKNIEQAAFAMAKSIKKRGIKEVPFMGDAMNEAFEKLPEKAQNALVLDLEDILISDFQKNPLITAKKI